MICVYQKLNALKVHDDPRHCNVLGCHATLRDILRQLLLTEGLTKYILHSILNSNVIETVNFTQLGKFYSLHGLTF